MKQIIEKYSNLPKLYKVQLIALLLVGICAAMAVPAILGVMYGSADPMTFTARIVISSTIGVLVSVAWLVVQEKLFSRFVLLTGIEFISYLAITVYVIIVPNYDSYLIVSALVGATIGSIVSGGSSKIHQNITDDTQHRTDYGFFQTIVTSAGSLIGSALVVAFGVPGVTLGLIYQLIGLVGFELVDCYVYLQLKKK